MVVVRSWLNCCIWSVGDRAYPFRMNKLTFGLCYARFMVVRVVFFACRKLFYCCFVELFCCFRGTYLLNGNSDSTKLSGCLLFPDERNFLNIVFLKLYLIYYCNKLCLSLKQIFQA